MPEEAEVSNNPEEFPEIDREIEAEGDDEAEQHHAEPILEDLPEPLQKEVADQVEQIKREAAENPKVGH